MASPPHPAPPSLALAASELVRWGLESAHLALDLPRLLARSPRGDGHPVLVLPGYGGGDATTAPLRVFLRRLGYDARPLALGINIDAKEDRIARMEDAVRFREKMGVQVVERVRAIASERGGAVSLVGWSMGGLYAFDAAREAPEVVRRVVTLGSPFGDPRGTSMFSLMRRLRRSTVPVETQDFGGWLAKARSGDGSVPVTVLYSATDGIVGRGIARPDRHPSVECVEIESSHVGFVVNPEVWFALARRLAERPVDRGDGSKR